MQTVLSDSYGSLAQEDLSQLLIAISSIIDNHETLLTGDSAQVHRNPIRSIPIIQLLL